MFKKLLIIFLFLFVSAICWPNKVYADMGPMPTSDIRIYYDNKEIQDKDFYAQMLSCVAASTLEDGWFTTGKPTVSSLNIKQYDENKKCYWINSGHAWGGDCKESVCHFFYMLPDEFRLALFIPSLDKTFITNEIARTNFNSYYKVKLFSDGTAVISESLLGYMSDFSIAYIVTNVIELFVAFLYIIFSKYPKRIYLSIIFGNTITLPIVWFVLPNMILLSEIIALILEAFIIYRFNKKYITTANAVSFSFVCNFISFFAGIFVRLIISLPH